MRVAMYVSLDVLGPRRVIPTRGCAFLQLESLWGIPPILCRVCSCSPFPLSTKCKIAAAEKLTGHAISVSTISTK